VKKTVRVRYFAVLRDQRGLAEESVATGTETAGELYQELAARHGFTLSADRLRVAVNDEFQPWNAPVRDADSVVFIPPVAGG
jgi:molybdopterin synthase sulfur carrier subunit